MIGPGVTVRAPRCVADCVKCNRRPAEFEIQDGVMHGEEIWICGPCLLGAVNHYPEVEHG
jgi:hypothetical protein